MFGILATVVLLIVASVVGRSGYAGLTGVANWQLNLQLMTRWADLDTEIALMGVAWLAWYQVERSAGELEFCWDAIEDWESDEIEGLLSSGLASIRHSLFALVCAAPLGFIAAAASAAQLWLVFSPVVPAVLPTSWHQYLAAVLGSIAIVRCRSSSS
jgi:hypothetical protein